MAFGKEGKEGEREGGGASVWDSITTQYNLRIGRILSSLPPSLPTANLGVCTGLVITASGKLDDVSIGVCSLFLGLFPRFLVPTRAKQVLDGIHTVPGRGAKERGKEEEFVDVRR